MCMRCQAEPQRANVPTMLRLGAVVMKVSDVDRAAAFWSAALGYEKQPNNPAFLVPDGAPGTRLHLGDEDRTHLDLWADNEADQQAQVERLISLGAQRVDWEYRHDRRSRTRRVLSRVPRMALPTWRRADRSEDDDSWLVLVDDHGNARSRCNASVHCLGRPGRVPRCRCSCTSTSR